MRKEKGITLIALVITIIVLLILAGVTIATLTGDNGLLTKAGEAKNASEIAEEKDIISISAIQAQSENKYGNLEESKFSEALNTNSKAGNKASIIAEDIGSFTVKFESNRYYEVDKNGNIGYVENVTGEKTLTVQCVNSKNEVLGEYEYLVLTDRYSKLPPAVDKYESSEEKIEGKITENKTIQVLYYLICNDDTTLVFTGLDSNGNITTNENEIVSYMVGDGSSTNGNGLKEKEVYVNIAIPNSYNNKEVIQIGEGAFSKEKKIKKVKLLDDIRVILNSFTNSSIESIEFGKNIQSLGSNSFLGCSELEKIILKNPESINVIFNINKGRNLKEVIFEENQNDVFIKDNIVYSKDKEKLLFCPSGINENISILSDTKIIGANAFFYSTAQTIEIPDSVTEIQSSVFFNAYIKTIKIGENIQTIGGNAFLNSNLETVILDSKNIASSTNNRGRLLENRETIYIKSDITEIGSYITDNYNIVETDKEGYIKYVKN